MLKQKESRIRFEIKRKSYSIVEISTIPVRQKWEKNASFQRKRTDNQRKRRLREKNKLFMKSHVYRHIMIIF